MNVHKLNEAQKRQRFDGCKRLLEMSALTINRIVFTDEKNFTLSAPTNSQNDRVYGEGKKKTIEPNRLLRQRAHFTKSIMVSAGVSVNGKTRLHFVESGVKMNANCYVNMLLHDRLLPDCRTLYPDGNFIFQQDWAPSHSARLTIEYLRNENISYLQRDTYPASFPDGNPMDYRIWAILEQKVYDGVASFDTIDQLKTALLAAWDDIDIETVKQIIVGENGFRQRLLAVVKNGGGHIEHLMRK
jgi:hypothetical protein